MLAHDGRAPALPNCDVRDALDGWMLTYEHSQSWAFRFAVQKRAAIKLRAMRL
jgi:hypothetical protein